MICDLIYILTGFDHNFLLFQLSNSQFFEILVWGFFSLLLFIIQFLDFTISQFFNFSVFSFSLQFNQYDR
ncbi:hypothetical protein DD587_31225 [Klebsiella pneumoniae]|nr:hypothetical protein DD587_31225 [Klebsiella pneumoniae]